jgi:hypothetical protein
MNIKQFSTEKLAEWWNIFADREWPLDYPNPKPSDYDDLKPYDFAAPDIARTKQSVVIPLMLNIEEKIGIKECMRWYHIHNKGKTNLQFEWFWFIYHTLNFTQS